MDLATLRHSCSHVMAQAVKSLWPDVKLAIGPSIEDGFYYDFDKREPFTPEDLERIESGMRQIISEDQAFTRQDLSKEEAQGLFKQLGENYKLELLRDIPDDKVSVYKTGGNFVDLCRGPHVASTGQIKAFKLLSIAGAYWHGIETNPMLQRIYGTAFDNAADLTKYLEVLEEAKKRDHRKLGKELELFDIYHDEAGAGLVFYHPKGAVLRNILETYEKEEHLKRGYQMVITPHILKGELWKTSGHAAYYRENMYMLDIDEQEYAVKPMNCPGHILIYKAKTRSYRELPLRLFELGTVYRHEKSGVLHGLLRVRSFTQDDAHIFCMPQQLKPEIKGVIDFVFDTMALFGFKDLKIEISTRPAKSIGTDEDWSRATSALKESLDEKNLAYDVNEGDGAFYGPKIDIKLRDAIGRYWQCATIQCDFALPQNFDLNYVAQDGKVARPVMLHRVIFGSLERFIGTLIEHYAGNFPVWLAPEQVLIIPIKSECEGFAREAESLLKEGKVRASIDLSSETLNKKIRNAELKKVPYVLVLGPREVTSRSVSVRSKTKGDLGAMGLGDFIAYIKKEIEEKK
ncbi:MAG: threonine--tRNA ligase [Candidatus Omnitrophica bacterium]|nr:threonine--tRNA ligase [Candidatus Omnitrophota bacterium]